MKACVTTLLTEPNVQVTCLDKGRYEVVRSSVLKNLYAYGPLTHEQLGSLVQDHLKFKLEDFATWHYITVEQDLEARGEIRHVPDSDPPLIEVNI